MRRAVCWLALVLLSPLTARAEPPSEPSSADASPDWEAPDRAPMPALDVERAPAPLPDPIEPARRTFDFGAELGAVVPHCEQSGGPGCAALNVGLELALTASMRPTAHFAFGAELRRFAFDAFGADSTAATRAGALFAGVMGRVFLLQRGVADPYLELALGGGSLGLESEARTGRARERASFAPAVRGALGVDCAATPWLRVGGFFAWTHYVPNGVAHCDAIGCSTIPASASWLAIGATSLGIRVSLTMGELL